MAEKAKSNGEIFDTKVLKRTFDFVKPYIKQFYLLIFLTVLTGVLAPIRPYLTQATVDQHILLGDAEGLVFMVWLMVILSVVQAVVQFAYSYLSGWLGQYIVRDIRVKLYEHITQLKLQFYDKTPIGNLITRTISDVESLSNVFTDGLAAMVGDLLQLIFILGLMFYTDWKLTLVSMAAFPLLILATYVFKEKVKYAFNEVRTAVSSLNTFAQEHITGMSIVQIFGSEKAEFNKFNDINREHRRAHLKSVMYYSVYFPVAEVIGAMGTGLLVWYGARGVLHEDVTLGILIAFIMYIAMFFRPIRQIADRFNTLQMGIVSSSRLLKLLDDHSFIQVSGSHIPKKVEGNVKFDNVFFAYNATDYVLKDISFEVKKGETVALVGATGAGKSSIINLLSRFYEIEKGEITVDGRNILDYNLSALRKNIGVVLQDVFLFSDSIMNNITLSNPEITRESVLKAAELVGAKTFIEKLPEGFDYNVMERGATLSVGQRQLISFVRTMVYDPAIMVLDEATSSVDTETEELIQNAITNMMKGRTSIIIAHRLATIQKADKIIVLDKGEIKEVGTHDELLAKNGYYANLHQMQYKSMANLNV
ncbi:MAG: ABC transporter ATP-binding protein [Bacteroidetes bacterium]|nr:MAG: ABC transporter ATP-binding protein [Bacteroidota bacterium]